MPSLTTRSATSAGRSLVERPAAMHAIDSVRVTPEMSLFRIRSFLHRSRARVVVLVVLASLTGAVAVHHVPSIDMDVHMASAGVCLAVLGIAVAAVLGAAARPAAGRRTARLLWRRSVVVLEAITVPARAGPRHLQVLRL